MLSTDENGEWNNEEVIIGHDYQLWFYHEDYKIKENTQQYQIGEEALEAETVTAVKRESVPETAVEDFKYKVLNGSYCEVTGYTGTETKIRIPSEINGYIVQSIGSNAFKNNQNLTIVVFPETVETMGDSLFSGCTSLKEVRLNEGLKAKENLLLMIW